MLFNLCSLLVSIHSHNHTSRSDPHAHTSKFYYTIRKSHFLFCFPFRYLISNRSRFAMIFSYLSRTHTCNPDYGAAVVVNENHLQCCNLPNDLCSPQRLSRIERENERERESFAQSQEIVSMYAHAESVRCVNSSSR